MGEAGDMQNNKIRTLFWTNQKRTTIHTTAGQLFRDVSRVADSQSKAASANQLLCSIKNIFRLRMACPRRSGDREQVNAADCAFMPLSSFLCWVKPGPAPDIGLLS